MLRYLSICLCSGSLLFFAGCKKSDDIRTLSENQVYFFYQTTCQHCHTAAGYIKEKHPMLKVKALDVKMPGNMRLFQQAAKTYQLGSTVGTPLICFGKDYIMGWSDEEAKKFDILSQKYE